MNQLRLGLFLLLAISMAGVNGSYNPPCYDGDETCGSSCCSTSNGRETCFNSGDNYACCAYPSTACCNYYGCQCKAPDQKCCNDYRNTVCYQNQTCCPNNHGGPSCCDTATQTCNNGYCVAKSECPTGQIVCENYPTDKCCNPSNGEQCYKGYQSGICCQYPSQGCCGQNGYAIGGCKCRSPDQKCCGNVQNTICYNNQTCCINSDGYGSCCDNVYQECHNGQCRSKPDTCLPGQEVCLDSGGTRCCDTDYGEQCYRGGDSGVCCKPYQTGCCGNNGYSANGCKCCNQDQQCCGNYQNTICNSYNQICCVNQRDGSGRCCNAFTEQCSFGRCVPKQGNQCFAGPICKNQHGFGTQCCKRGYGCFQGRNSGVCCKPPEYGCCGKNGRSINGCKCIKPHQKCCGNYQNTICKKSDLCCYDRRGGARCCNSHTSRCWRGRCIKK